MFFFQVVLFAAVLSFCLRNKEGDFVQYDSKHDLDKDMLLQETHKHASNVPRIVTEGISYYILAIKAKGDM